MEDAGQKLKRVRERLNLRYRDVEEASSRIADRHQSDEFSIALSRLSDIENKGTVPTIYRLYALCAIYRLDPLDVLQWYGVDFSQLASDAAAIPLQRTHGVGFHPAAHGSALFPLALDPGIDPSKTTYLSRMIQRWGTLPLMLLSGLEPQNHRYAFIGTDDWTMYPLLHPGALVMVDESKRKIADGGWQTEFDRPIYLLEHRGGYSCSWVSVSENQLILQPHPSSASHPRTFLYPEEIDVLGQIVGVAMHWDGAKPSNRS